MNKQHRQNEEKEEGQEKGQEQPHHQEMEGQGHHQMERWRE